MVDADEFVKCYWCGSNHPKDDMVRAKTMEPDVYEWFHDECVQAFYAYGEPFNQDIAEACESDAQDD